MGYGTLAAATIETDASPMEGFEPSKMDDKLGLDKNLLASAVILGVGYRDGENDWLVKLPKVRKPREELSFKI